MLNDVQSDDGHGLETHSPRPLGTSLPGDTQTDLSTRHHLRRVTMRMALLFLNPLIRIDSSSVFCAHCLPPAKDRQPLLHVPGCK